MPLIPEHTVQSGTEYLSSRNIHYVKLNSQSQHPANEADLEINHQSLVKSLLHRSMSRGSHSVREKFIGTIYLKSSILARFPGIRKLHGKVDMVKPLATLLSVLCERTPDLWGWVSYFMVCFCQEYTLSFVLIIQRIFRQSQIVLVLLKVLFSLNIIIFFLALYLLFNQNYLCSWD